MSSKKTALLVLVLALSVAISDAQNRIPKSYTFIEPLVQVSHINQNAGFLGGVKMGFVFRDRYSAAIEFLHLYSQNIEAPLRTRRSTPLPYATLSYIGGEFEYKLFQLEVIDWSIVSLFGVGRSSYTDPTNAIAFSNESFKIIETGIVGGIKIIERLLLRVGGSYGFLIDTNDIYYSIPTIGFSSGEGYIPIDYHGLSASISLRFIVQY